MLVVQVTDVEKHNDEIPLIENKESLPETVQWLVDLLGPTDIEMVTETYWRACGVRKPDSRHLGAGR